MARDAILPVRGPRALDLANFFIADAQTGFGPFVAVYLTMHKWTQGQIGFALTLGTIVALISQLPAGALVDAVHNKRAAASGALLGVIVAALLLAIWPSELPVMVAQTLGEIVAGYCWSATEAESVAAHHLYLYGSPGIEP
jgi:MFS family permease